ncbi:MAG: putative PilT domain protein/Type II secretion system protein E [Nitrosopumilales archaeon]|nr:MAG: putative PilT domain protein/Type II secretion system protein E [Nitrosopumilales archaeon]
MSKIVVDTSIIVNGQIIKLIENGSIKNTEIIIPMAVLDELQSQAAQKREQGFIGLEEIKKIQENSNKNGLTIKFEGKRPTADDIHLSSRGRIDAIIQDVAKQIDAILFTSDYAQSLVAQAEGIKVNYQKPEKDKEDLEFLKFFDSQTMSVHLKEGISPFAKRGKPGSFELKKLEEKILTRDYLHNIATQILEQSKITDSSTIEISKAGALVIQYDDYRIAVTQPPFSDGYEITIVHPIVKLTLSEYDLSEKLMSRVSERAEGILISGPPGSGKSTFASSLANFYYNTGKIVKTFESPRDLQVDPGITQYTRLEGSFENTADILLLVRPDYTIFDEIRRREDFGIFSDLRLAGVGMVGVIHANSPLDAIQRFIGKIELGIIPNVLDTVIFVKDGKIAKVYELELKVKVPSGMTEQDLARPVIEVRNFEDHDLEHEIYTFGEENVIVPVSKKASKFGIEQLAEQRVKDAFKKFDPRAEVVIQSENRVKVMVGKQYISSIIGRGGSNITNMEKLLKVKIDVVEKDSNEETSTNYELPFSFSESKTALILTVSREYMGMHADVYVNNKYLNSSRIGRKGQIKFPKRSDASKQLMKLASSQDDIEIFLKDF